MSGQHTISVLVENKFGVLARVSGLFSGRGYNIESLSVNSTHDPEVSKMTIVTSGDEAVIEQIDKQLNKLVDVISVTDLASGDFIERVTALGIRQDGVFERTPRITNGFDISAATGGKI